MIASDVMRMVSRSRNRTLPQFETWKDIESWWSYHSSIVNENWHLYLGQHNLFLKRWLDETEGDFLSRVENATIENHIAPVIDTIVAYLYGTPNEIKRYVKREEEVDEELTSILKRRVWKHAPASNYHDLKALNALVTGYTVVKREFCDIRTRQPFILAKPQEINDYGYIKKTLQDSEYCVPLPYIAPTGEVDPTRLGAILIIAEYDNFVGNKTVMNLMARPRQKFSQIEYIDDQVWLKWRRKDGENQFTQIDAGNGNRNKYGNVATVFTVYRNTGDPFYVEGDSQVPAIKTLNLELNELANGDKDTILYHQDPILMGLNGATLPENFRRTKNAVVEVSKKDAKFEYLTWEGQLEPSQNRQESIRRAVTNVTGVSLIPRGIMKDIGQIRSGPPLKALFTADRNLMARKFAQFTANEMEDMRADLAMIQVEQPGLGLKVDIDTSFHIEFNQDFLGIDRLLDEEIHSLQLGSGEISIEEMVREVHPDWNEEKVTAEVKRIKEQRQQKSNQSAIRQSPDKKGNQQDGKDK